MYFNPPTGKNPSNPFYHRSIEEQRREMQEAVTVELDFKSDAEGKKAGGTMVRKGVYRMTFKNNAEMNKFMDTHADKLNEEKDMDPRKHVSRSKKNPDMFCVFDKDGNEVKLFKNKSDAEEYAMKNHDALMESTPEYRRMMKRYKGSDNEKVFNMLRAKGYKVGEQDDTLIQNLLKRHRGNVKKVVDQIVKDYPGKFDVERMMMDHVEIDEEKKLDSRGLGVNRQSGLGSKRVSGVKARKKKLDSRGLGVTRQSGLGSKKEDFEIDEAKATARNIVKGLGDADGPFTVVAMKRDKVIKQETTKRRDMLPAIISTMRKEVGSGVTIAIEDKNGTIRNTFKESVQLDEESSYGWEDRMSDLISFLELMGGEGNPGASFLTYFDYNDDGTLSFEDLLILLSLWGGGVEPIDAANYVNSYTSRQREEVRKNSKQMTTVANQIMSKPSIKTNPPMGKPTLPPSGDGVGNVAPQLGMMEKKTIDNLSDYLAEGSE